MFNFKVVLVASLLASATASSIAQQQVTPPAPIQVTSPIVTINNSSGDQTFPHVDGDLAAYTDVADNSIRYYTFSTGVDAAIPLGISLGDTLSNVHGNRICFTRETPTADFEQAIFDITAFQRA